jgi:hypothetical protein
VLDGSDPSCFMVAEGTAPVNIMFGGEQQKQKSEEQR